MDLVHDFLNPGQVGRSQLRREADGEGLGGTFGEVAVPAGPMGGREVVAAAALATVTPDLVDSVFRDVHGSADGVTAATIKEATVHAVVEDVTIVAVTVIPHPGGAQDLDHAVVVRKGAEGVLPFGQEDLPSEAQDGLIQVCAWVVGRLA